MRIQFYLRFKTSFGQSLWISDNGELGTDLIKGAIPMTYLNDEFWVADIKIDKEEASSFHYKYILRHEDGEIVPEFGSAEATPALPASVPEPISVGAHRAGESKPQFEMVTACATCALCASRSVHRSRLSGTLEHLRRQFTRKRPYRCYECGWRGWIDVATSAPATVATPSNQPDLHAIDLAFRAIGVPAISKSITLSSLDPAWLPQPEQTAAHPTAR